jgi:MFS family permease
LPTLVAGVRWWWLRQGLGKQFLIFQLTSALFDVGEFVFFLLYNLYLLDLGYSEAFIGKLSSATTAGTFAAALLGVWLTRRLGLRSTVLIAIGGAALTSAGRVLAESQAHLLAAAFLQGAFLSLWAVSLPPTVASLTTEGNRVLGFSIVSSLGVGMGVLGGFAGGQLPDMFAHWAPYMNAVATKRASLLAGSAIVILGVIPAFTLDLPPASGGRERKIYPRGQFIFSFLAALFVWSVATGAFNPFFNTYFSRVLHLSVEHIGAIFSTTQLVQVVALLAAPAVLRRTGEIKGIAALQVATAAALVWLMLTANATEVAFVYGTYMCCQYMSEPCVFSMLMNRVGESERSGASALNFLVSSFAGAISAFVAGHVISKKGYSTLLGGAAVLAVMASLLFYKLVGRSAESQRY